MSTLFALRRANGDWFAVDDSGESRVPVFHSLGEASLARTRDTSMECFRPVLLDHAAVADLTTTDEATACYWLVENPLLKLRRGRRMDHAQLLQALADD